MTSKTELELEAVEADWLDEEDEDEYEDDAQPYRYYDQRENYWELRAERGDVAGIDHNSVVDYLVQVLRYLFRFQPYTIDREVNYYETFDEKEKPIYPDVFVMKSPERLKFNSFHIGVSGPPPEFVFEVISERTISNDIKVKPSIYERWGVHEYFAYDRRERKRRSKKPRLYGWELVQGKMVPMQAQADDGRMWSKELECWLVPAGEILELHDRQNNRHLTPVEWRDIEQQRADAEQQRAENEREKAEVERHKAERLALFLRQQGFNPDEI